VESVSKTRVTEAVARDIAIAAFGSRARLAGFNELTDGWFNAAYELVLADGRRFVIKVAPPPNVEVLGYEHDIIHAEVDALQLVRQHTDAPVPTVEWVDDSCTLVPSPFFAMTYIPGVSLWNVRETITLEERAELDRTIGRHLRAMNEITGPAFGMLAPSMPNHASWTPAFTELFEMLLADRERRAIELPISSGDARAAVAAVADALDEVSEPRLVHWDLWDGNVLIDPTTHRLTGLLDFERALWGDPLMETQFATGTSAAFTDGYGKEMPVTVGERRRRDVYTLYLHLVMSIEGTYRQYPEDPIGDWARAQLVDDLARVTG